MSATVGVTPDLAEEQQTKRPSRRYLTKVLRPWMFILQFLSLFYYPVNKNTKQFLKIVLYVLIILCTVVHIASEIIQLIIRIPRAAAMEIRTAVTIVAFIDIFYSMLVTLFAIGSMLFLSRSLFALFRRMDDILPYHLSYSDRTTGAVFLFFWTILALIPPLYDLATGQTNYLTKRPVIRIINQSIDYFKWKFVAENLYIPVVIASVITEVLDNIGTLLLRGLFTFVAFMSALCFRKITHRLEYWTKRPIKVEQVMQLLSDHAELSRQIHNFNSKIAWLNMVFYSNSILTILDLINQFIQAQDNLSLSGEVAVGVVCLLLALAIQTGVYAYLLETAQSAIEALQIMVEKGLLPDRSAEIHLSRVIATPASLKLAGKCISSEMVITIVGLLVSYAFLFSEISDKNKPVVLDMEPLKQQFRNEMASLLANYSIKVHCNWLQQS